MDTAEAIQSLSDKEREALRLLLEGHDAKSSAQKLGVSHHTIHDRLSRARRKLGTTGSREAALLVKSHENRTRESFVHETIGCAPAAKLPEKFFGAQLKRPASPGSHGRRKGLIIMAISAMFVAAVTALNFQVDSPQATRDITIDPAPLKTAAETDARRAQAAPRSIVAAREFLALVDSGDAAGSYEATTQTFRDARGFDLWELALAFHAKEGGARRRTLASVETDTTPANARYEALEILTFDTLMLNGDHKSERIVMALMQGRWQVVTIDINDVDGG